MIFLKENIIGYFSSVRRVIALLLTLVFSYLTLTGKITQEQFMPVFSMVLGYYFWKSTALDIPGKPEEYKQFNKEI